MALVGGKMEGEGRIILVLTDQCKTSAFILSERNPLKSFEQRSDMIRLIFWLLCGRHGGRESG